MINRIEKLSLLSDLIAFSKLDKSLGCINHNFLLSVLRQLNISEVDFNDLMENSTSDKPLRFHIERIVQFYKLVLLLDIEVHKHDTQNSSDGIAMLYNSGLRMGLSHDSINKVLYLMDSFPNKIVPLDLLKDIVKTQYS